MEVFVGVNRNAPGVFKVIVPMTDHSWRGFCECGAPTDDLCRLDEKRMDKVVGRFRAWAYVRVMRTEVWLESFCSWRENIEEWRLIRRTL